MPFMSQISDLGVAKRLVMLKAACAVHAAGSPAARSVASRSGTHRAAPDRSCSTRLGFPRPSDRASRSIWAATRSCSFGYSRSLALSRTARRLQGEGPQPRVGDGEAAPVEDRGFALDQRGILVRFRVPRPRHRPIRGSTTPCDETIGSVGSGRTSSTVLVSGNGSARRISSRSSLYGTTMLRFCCTFSS